jgi:hypothetical protein
MLSQYEGLSLPQLFELMHDNVMPEAVSMFPATSAWLVLAGWVVGVLLLTAIRAWQQWRKNRYRRDALALLDELADDESADPVISAQRIAAVLKRTALAAYPRDAVAPLCGEAWSAFLVDSSNHDALVARHAAALGNAAYAPGADGRSLLQPARRWVEVHRA